MSPLARFRCLDVPEPIDLRCCRCRAGQPGGGPEVTVELKREEINRRIAHRGLSDEHQSVVIAKHSDVALPDSSAEPEQEPSASGWGRREQQPATDGEAVAEAAAEGESEPEPAHRHRSSYEQDPRGQGHDVAYESESTSAQTESPQTVEGSDLPMASTCRRISAWRAPRGGIEPSRSRLRLRLRAPQG